MAQTTFNSTLFDQIATALKEKCQELAVKKTICTATEVRQNETRELSKQVEAMIVVGGKHSANTLRLADIAREHTPIVQHIETEAELNWSEVAHCETVGVTAGASTPQWMIKRVVDHLERMTQNKKRGITFVLRRLIIRFTNLNVITALGAVAMLYASSLFQGVLFKTSAGFITLLYFLSIHLWNSLSSVEQTQHMGLSRYQFYRAHEHVLRFFSIACIVSLLVVSFFISHALFILMFLSTLAGLIYHFSFMRKIPTSRDLFAALAWSVLITFIPQAVLGKFVFSLTTIFFFVAIFFMAYFRSLMFDLRDIEGDRIFGRETLVTILGEKKMRRIMFAALWFCFVALIGFAFFAVFPHQTKFTWRRSVIFLLQIPVLIYIWLVLYFYKRLKNRNEAFFAILADTQFFIAGLGAGIAHAIML